MLDFSNNNMQSIFDSIDSIKDNSIREKEIEAKMYKEKAIQFYDKILSRADEIKNLISVANKLLDLGYKFTEGTAQWIIDGKIIDIRLLANDRRIGFVTKSVNLKERIVSISASYTSSARVDTDGEKIWILNKNLKEFMIDDFDWDSPYLEGNFYWRQAFEELERLANGGIDELISDFSNVLENLSKYKIHKN